MSPIAGQLRPDDQYLAQLRVRDSAPPDPVVSALMEGFSISPEAESLQTILERAEKESPEIVFNSADPAEIIYQKNLHRDMEPAVRVWFHAYLLELEADTLPRARAMTLAEFMRLYGRCSNIQSTLIEQKILYLQSQLRFDPSSGFTQARSAAELTPDILMEHAGYAAPEAFFMLSQYVRRSIQDQLEQEAHHKLVIRGIAVRKQAATAMQAAA